MSYYGAGGHAANDYTESTKTQPRWSIAFMERGNADGVAGVQDPAFFFEGASGDAATDATISFLILNGSLPVTKHDLSLATNASAGIEIKTDRFTAKPGIVLNPQSSAPAQVTGHLYYNSGSGELNYWDGSSWQVLTTGSGMTAHDLTGAFHTEDATGGAGNFLKADSATTFSWQAHGLVASDVGAYTIAQTDSAIDADIATHAALANVHHAQNHALIDTTGHTVSGLSPGQFLKAITSTTYGFQVHGLSAADVGAYTTGQTNTEIANQISTHAALPNEHHSQSHDLTGSDHTDSGLTNGHFLKADSATTFSWQAHGLTAPDVGAYTQLQTDAAIDTDINTHAGLSSVHHNQVHDITGPDHTASGLTIGWVIAADSPTTFSWQASSGVSGTGTQWALPVWSTTSTLGDSMISQNSGGTAATVGGNLGIGDAPASWGTLQPKAFVKGAAGSGTGPHAAFVIDDADDVPALLFNVDDHNAIQVLFDAYYDGTDHRSASVFGNAMLQKSNLGFSLWGEDTIAVGSTITWGEIASWALDTRAFTAHGSVQINTIDAGVTNYDKFLVSDTGLVKYRTSSQVRADLSVYTMIQTNSQISSQIATHAALPNEHHAQNHNLIDTTGHPIAGATAGHFLKAFTSNTYGFAAHGLVASDVGAYTSSETDNAIDTDINTHAAISSVHHNQTHDLTGGDHTDSGLTLGHFLKATSASSFAWQAHGLSASDVSAEPAGSIATHASDNDAHHALVTVTALPLTLSGQAVTFNYNTNHFKLTGNNLEVGTDTPGTDEILTWNGTSAVWATASGGASYDAFLGIGSGNKLWMNCSLEMWNPTASFNMNTTGRVVNAVTGTGYLVYSVPLSMTKDGKNLYISGTFVGIDDADIANYVTTTVVYAYTSGGGSARDTDPTDKTSSAFDYFTALNMGTYYAVKVILTTTTANVGNLDVQVVKVQYYYA